jgi:aromatic ring-cleaving dioxygenase
MMIKRVHKLIIISVFLLLVVFPLSSTLSQEHTTVIHLKIGSTTVWINDQRQELDLAPFLYQKRTMVPLRFFSEAFGATIEWVANPKLSGEGLILIDLPQQGTRIKLHTQVYLVFVESTLPSNPIPSVKTHTLDIAPFVVKPQNRSVVPIRFISEIFGASLDWNAEYQSITVTYTR